MNKLALLGLAVMFAACAGQKGGMKKQNGGVLPAAQQGQTEQFVDEAVEVMTNPAGARVQVNGGLVGFSPVKTTVRRYWRGAPGSMKLDVVTVEVQAVESGQCDQSGIFGEDSRKVPVPVFFNMTCSAAGAEPAGAK